MLTRFLSRTTNVFFSRTPTASALKTSQLFQMQTVATPSSFKIPTLYSYGLMSNCAYLHNKPDVPNESQAILTASQWDMKEFSHGSQKSGYVGCIFINHHTKQVVVAHAGTLPERYQTLLADLRGVVQGRPDGLLIDGLLQVKDSDIAELLKRGYHLSFTGHSLGGFLAEMSVFACHRGLIVKHPQVSAVTFDSPGSLEIMEAWQSNLQEQRIDLNRLNVTTFLSSPNLVNTLYRHPGTVYRLIRSLGGLNGVFNSISYLLASHNLNEMIHLFDPTTGLPRDGTYCRMEDWPLADYQEVFDLKSHPVSGAIDLAVTKPLGILCSMLGKLNGTSKTGPVIALSGGRRLTILGRELGAGKEKVYHTIFDTTSAEGLTKMIETHYQVTSSLPLNRSMARVNFLPSVYDFLCVYDKCKAEPTYQEFLKHNGIDELDLPDYSVEEGMVVTKLSIDVFELRNKAYNLLDKYGELIEKHDEHYEKYFKSQVGKLQKEVKDLQDENLTSLQLEERLNQLKVEWNKVEEGGKTFMAACIVAEAAGAKVAQVLGKDDYAPERQQEREQMAKIMHRMDTFMQRCVVIKTPNADVLQLPPDEIHPSVGRLVDSFFSGGSSTTRKKPPQ